MCSSSSSLSMPIRMENNFQGDLTDILRVGNSTTTGTGSSSSEQIMNSDSWQFSSDDHQSMKFSSSSAVAMESEDKVEELEDRRDNFGDPFSSYLRDPLLHELDLSTTTSTGAGFFTGPSSEMNIGAVDMEGRTFGPHVLGHPPHHGHELVNKSPCNIFSRMLQISPGEMSDSAAMMSPRGVGVGVKSAGGVVGGGGVSSASVMVGSSGDMIINANSNSSKGCLLDNIGGGGVGMQISSPRNPGGIKRRKSQAKKVVCIPAPAAVNSRPTGEVVPSDLWAWRKYGQKPIKGSPYPRGYYRCSSSKGCSARKQVERSRTDPNMLVITYTSEHNHPWPTQRNALAGSTRSQPSKAAGSGSKTSHLHPKPTSPPKEEEHKAADESMDNEGNHNHVLSPVTPTVGSCSIVKEEEFEDIEKLPLEIDHHHHFSNHDQGFPYRPSMPDTNNSHSEDFFADLEEIAADPLNLLFSQCFTAEEQQKGGGNKSALDPFSLFDWSGDQNESFGHESKRRL